MYVLLSQSHSEKAQTGCGGIQHITLLSTIELVPGTRDVQLNLSNSLALHTFPGLRQNIHEPGPGRLSLVV